MHEIHKVIFFKILPLTIWTTQIKKSLIQWLKLHGGMIPSVTP